MFSGIFDPSISYNTSFLSFAGFSKLHLTFGCGTLHLLLSVVGWSLSVDNWVRHQSIVIIEYHEESFHLPFLLLLFSSILGPWAIQPLVPGHTSNVRNGLFLSWVHFKLDQLLVGHSHKFCATFNLAHSGAGQILGHSFCGRVSVPVPPLETNILTIEVQFTKFWFSFAWYFVCVCAMSVCPPYSPLY